MPATKKWFRAKKYGWGWTPQTFEGWLTLLIYAVLLTVVSIIFASRLRDPLFDPRISVGIFIFLVGILTSGLVVIAYYTGEKPHWHWGNKKK